MQAAVDLSRRTQFVAPFPHFHSSRALDPVLASRLLSWLKEAPEWRLVVTDFYEQFEFCLADADVPDGLALLEDGSFASELAERMRDAFQESLSDDVEIVAHRLVPGQRIGVHNDNRGGGDTHRLSIHLNSGWTSAQGGVFVVFTGPAPEAIQRVFVPVHNSAVAFSVSGKSHHAVSTVHEGERFSLVCSFRSA